jgi:hypothetical protein
MLDVFGETRALPKKYTIIFFGRVEFHDALTFGTLGFAESEQISRGLLCGLLVPINHSMGLPLPRIPGRQGAQTEVAARETVGHESFCHVSPSREIDDDIRPIRIFLRHPQRTQAHRQPSDVVLGDGAIIHENNPAMPDALLRPIFEQWDDG